MGLHVVSADRVPLMRRVDLPAQATRWQRVRVPAYLSGLRNGGQDMTAASEQPYNAPDTPDDGLVGEAPPRKLRRFRWWRRDTWRVGLFPMEGWYGIDLGYRRLVILRGRL